MTTLRLPASDTRPARADQLPAAVGYTHPQPCSAQARPPSDDFSRHSGGLQFSLARGYHEPDQAWRSWIDKTRPQLAGRKKK